jgi:hypothetical protein
LAALLVGMRVPLLLGADSEQSVETGRNETVDRRPAPASVESSATGHDHELHAAGAKEGSGATSPTVGQNAHRSESPDADCIEPAESSFRRSQGESSQARSPSADAAAENAATRERTFSARLKYYRSLSRCALALCDSVMRAALHASITSFHADCSRRRDLMPEPLEQLWNS